MTTLQLSTTHDWDSLQVLCGRQSMAPVDITYKSSCQILSAKLTSTKPGSSRQKCYRGHCQCRKTQQEKHPVLPLSMEYVEPSIISVTDMETDMETEMMTAMMTKRAVMSFFVASTRCFRLSECSVHLYAHGYHLRNRGGMETKHAGLCYCTAFISSC